MAKRIRNEMTHSEVIDTIATETEQPKAVVKGILQAYKDLAQQHVGKGSVGSFKMLGLVKLLKVQRKAGTARNPSTGEQIKVPAKRVVRAKPLAGLKTIDL